MPGVLMAIGPEEDPACKRDILKALVDRAGDGPLGLAQVFSRDDEAPQGAYESALADLGVSDLRVVEFRERSSSSDPARLKAFDGVRGMVVVGDDQLTLSSQLGESALEARLRALLQDGGVVAGVAAGAGVLGAAMVMGDNLGTYHVACLHLSPGLGLSDLVIDQHFAEGACMGRLVAAVAMIPGTLGVAIDKNAALIIEDERMNVLGHGSIYVVDGLQTTHSNVGESDSQASISVHGLRLHVLNAEDAFDLRARTALPGGAIAH